MLFGIWRNGSLLIFLFLVAGSQARGCGFTWQPALGSLPFVSDSGEFEYWKQLGASRVSPSLQIPVYLRFKPSDRSQSLLPSGWSIPLLDSRMEQKDDDSFVMHLPDGSQTALIRQKNPAILQGGNWTAEIKNNIITAWAACGWKLKFLNGRLIHIQTPENQTISLSTDLKAATAEVRVDGSAILKCAPVTDGFTVIGLKIITDQNVSMLSYGERPDIVFSNGTNVVSQILPTVRSIMSKVGNTEFDYNTEGTLSPSLKVGEMKFVWNPIDTKLITDGFYTYRETICRNIPCLSRVSPEGDIEAYGNDLDSGVAVVKEFGLPWKFKKFFTSGMAPNKVRTIEESADGENWIETRRFSYDSSGSVTRAILQEKTVRTVFDAADRTIQTSEIKSGKILANMTYDSVGQLKSLKNTGGEFQVNVSEQTITRIKGSEKDIYKLNNKQFQNFMEHFHMPDVYSDAN